MSRRSPISASTGCTTGCPPPTRRRSCSTRRRAAWCRRAWRARSSTAVGARAVAMKIGQQRRLLAVSEMPTDDPSGHRHARHVLVPRHHRGLRHAVRRSDDDVMRVVGPAPMGGEFVEIVLDERPLRAAMLRFSINILLLSLLISGITATLVYLALHYMFVRPMRRITANMMAFRERAGEPRRASSRRPARQDEIGTAERELAAHAARPRLAAAAEEPPRRARPRGVEDQSRPAQPAHLGAAVLRPAVDALPIRACSASRPS